ncbi:isoprenylcysteine alpha-carbonyl methylesterase ICME isoform X2 [Magnolia sinica]|uniref:isoprenylcysteine alpha-carbonyl methylesterase ICME isoform X2 n=1 Tax=Magnolia sinica TaxID=86752 RepID=UPI00265844CC|nr:isoprenylcysteine alpha-carbonyl methylesterase ICME isoform X2 [Magnolia sinica]
MQPQLLHQTIPMPTMATMTLSGEDLSILSSSSTSIDDEAVTKALLPRIPSFSNNHQRRRRVASDGSLPAFRYRQPSFSRDVGRAAAETYLLTRLSFRLLRYLGVGYRWITKFLALGCYAMLLMPGFLQVGYYYFFSSQVRRSVVYGDQPRNRLDLYLPTNINEPKPVVAFVTGGAWIIGYKAWGALLGKQLAERDIIVACIDYRNFPQGTISDMVKDASQGISFVCNNIAEYGGDPNRVYLMGQSAGAHIAACALLDQAIKECGEGDETNWSVSQIKAYFGISGGIMEGEQSLDRYSPESMVRKASIRHAASLLPRIILFHGTADSSIPSDASKDFTDALRGAGVQVDLILYEGKTHTDLFLQDPLRGGKDELLEDIIAVIHAGDEVALANDARAPPRRRLVPEFMLKMAHDVSPF